MSKKDLEIKITKAAPGTKTTGAKDTSTVQSVTRPSLDPSRLKRTKPQVDEEEAEKEPTPVSNGTIDKVVDFIFNPSRDKIREVTSIDRVQGRLLPQLDIIDLMWRYVIEIASYRYDAIEYEKKFKKSRPTPPNLIEEFTYRTAQWQKSIGAMNLKSGIDLALAEVETRSDELEEPAGGHGFEE